LSEIGEIGDGSFSIEQAGHRVRASAGGSDNERAVVVGNVLNSVGNLVML
jgi:hypothetical protein